MVATRHSSLSGASEEQNGSPNPHNSNGTSHRSGGGGRAAPRGGSGSGSDSESESSLSRFVVLPEEVQQKILSYLSFRQISDLRLVSHHFNHLCSNILNKTFQKLQAQMLNRFQSIKAKMPRRESARRNHPLACESDIVETLHMRLTLLQMTFGKHIERRHCCFFAGEILDEVYRILHYIRVTQKLGRPYKVTDELFDLSTMAMEYFKEHIEPTLPEISYFGTDFLDFTSSFGREYGSACTEVGTDFASSSADEPDIASQPVSASSTSKSAFLCLDVPSGSSSTKSGTVIDLSNEQPDPLPPSNMVLRKRIKRIRQGMKRYNSQLVCLRRELRSCKGKIAEQNKQILDYSTRLDEYDKKFEENSRKFSTLLQELNKCKTELQYWRSKSPANPPLCSSCGQSLPPTDDAQGESDLQALVNQGVIVKDKETEGVDEKARIDFIPIAGTSQDEEWIFTTGDANLELLFGNPKQPQQPLSVPTKDTVIAEGSSKRKLEDDNKETAKKPRRSKGRTRVKL